MGMNHTDSNSNGLCEKIFNAIGINPASRTRQHISYRPQEPVAAGTLPNPSVSNATQKEPAGLQQPQHAHSPDPFGTHGYGNAAEMVPVIFDPPVQSAVPNQKVKAAAPHVSNRKTNIITKISSKIEPMQRSAPKDDPPHVKGEEGKKSKVENINDKFSEFIDRAKIKIRATSSVGRGKSPSIKKDHINEKFSEFINRKRNKLRNTSNVGSGKSGSFK